MGTLFATSKWQLRQLKQRQSGNRARTALVHEAVVKGLDYVLSKTLRKGCPIPFNPELPFAMKLLDKDLPGSLREYVHYAVQALRKYQTTAASLEGHHSLQKTIDRAGIFTMTYLPLRLRSSN
jgi:hypothetical protein